MSDIEFVSADVRRPRAESVGRAIGDDTRAPFRACRSFVTRRHRLVAIGATGAATQRNSRGPFCAQELPQGSAVDSGVARRRAGRASKRVRFDHRAERLREDARCCTCSRRSIGPMRVRFVSKGIGSTICRRPDATSLRNRYFGMVFQFYHLLPELSVLENVLMPAMIGAGDLRLPGEPQRESRARAREMLEMVGLGHRIKAQAARTVGRRDAADGDRAGAGVAAASSAGR